MTQLIVNAADPTPPYEQVRRQLAALIGDGTLSGGDRLPPLRQLAGDLGLAVGTVARAYRELELAGLITSRRGGGTRVTDHPPRPAEDRPALLRAAEDFVARARAAGADESSILNALHKALKA